MQLVMFSKMLQEFDVAEMGRIVRDLGFDGVDLTVREAGHVLPQEVADKLEPAVATLADLGLTVPMITTGITSADDPTAEPIFRAAAACGIRRLKLGYWQVREFGTMREKIDEAAGYLVGIAKLAERHGVSANIHTHSGDFLSAISGVVWLLIRDYPREVIGAYPDLCHLSLEGARSGWKLGLDLLSTHANMVGVKNAGLYRDKDAEGNVFWRGKLVPVGEGLTPMKEAFGYLKRIGFDGPCSFHSEYQGSFSFKDMTTPELIEQTRLDLEYVKKLLADI